MAEKQESAKESSVERWDPFGELRRWRPLRSPLFPGSLRDFFGEGLEDWPTSRELRPAVDVHEDDARYTVSVELPGSKKEDVTVELEGDVLTIRGEKKSEREEKKERAHYVERRFGSFSRSFSLPQDALAEKIDASFQEGVLTLTIPKGGKAKPKTIAIKK
jgi:HSP20 family protein